MGVAFNRLRGVVFVLAGIFVFTSLLSLLIPSKVMVVRSVQIRSADTTLFSMVADLNNWRKWHPVFQQQDVVIAVSKPSTGVGATAKWISADKENTIRITDVQQNSLGFLLAREGENDIANILSVQTARDSLGVEVEWRALTHLKWYPWEKFYGIFLEQVTGPSYEAALNKLREFVEGGNPTAAISGN